MNGLHGIIFAYEKAPGLRELTEARMPGSVPFGGRYRVVDFMLSNMAGAGITDVGVVLHGNYQSLLDHIGSGKTWDMARKNGGLKLLPPFADARKFGVEEFRGKMEALSGVRSYLHEIRQKYVVLSDSDLIINLPLQKVLDAHIESGADITCVCTESGQFVENATYFTVNEAGRITETRCAPHKASGCRSLEIYLLSRDLLISLVDECAAQDKYSFRSDVLCAMGDKLDLRAFLWDGFAAQLRTVQEYYERSMQLLDPAIRSELLCAERPILAKEDDEAASYIAPDSRCVNSLIADGCQIEGSVEGSILFPGVKVGKGSQVKNCILFKNTVVEDGVTLGCVIADQGRPHPPRRHADRTRELPACREQGQHCIKAANRRKELADEHFVCDERGGPLLQDGRPCRRGRQPSAGARGKRRPRERHPAALRAREGQVG